MNHTEIYEAVSYIYGLQKELVFPLNPIALFDSLQNCEVVTFREYAKLANIPIDSVSEAMGSNDACTIYEPTKGHFYCFYNDDAVLIPPERIRFSLAHELGHILCGHFKMSGVSQSRIESGANQFASALLAPLPTFNIFGMHCPIQLQNFFGLSATAAQISFKDFLAWKTHSPLPIDTQLRDIVLSKYKENR